MAEKWIYDPSELIVLYVDNLMSIQAIAKMKGTGYRSVRNALLREGVVLRLQNTIGLHSFSEETKDKLRQKKIGDKNPNWQAASMTQQTRKLLSEARLGKKDSEEVCKKRAEARKGKGCGERNAMKREECIRKWIASNHIKPNKKELKLQVILEEMFPSEYAINTKGEIVILDGAIPDFVSVGNVKKVIELYGDYWHRGEDEQKRIDKFAKLGYDTLIVWERELSNVNVLKQRLSIFHDRDKMSQ